MRRNALILPTAKSKIDRGYIQFLGMRDRIIPSRIVGEKISELMHTLRSYKENSDFQLNVVAEYLQNVETLLDLLVSSFKNRSYRLFPEDIHKIRKFIYLAKTTTSDSLLYCEQVHELLRRHTAEVN